MVAHTDYCAPRGRSGPIPDSPLLLTCSPNRVKGYNWEKSRSRASSRAFRPRECHVKFVRCEISALFKMLRVTLYFTIFAACTVIAYMVGVVRLMQVRVTYDDSSEDC